MVSSWVHIFFVAGISFLNTGLFICACEQDKYEINGKCFMCSPVNGLRVKTNCTKTSDTICEPLEGFYCTDKQSGSCRYAVEHKKCSPGQYIKQKGTAVKDTECDLCENGTYSDGSFQMCKQHKKCEDLGLKEIRHGTHTTDAVCRRPTPAAVIAVIIAVGVPAILTLFGFAAFYIRRNNTCMENRVNYI